MLIPKSRTLQSIPIFCVLLVLFMFLSGCAASQLHEYGIFIGISANHAERLKNYHIVVIEPSEFSAEQIGELRKAGKQVYGYINIGAVEEYRSYYERFYNITLGIYKNWEDERWVDVTAPEWRDFLVYELGKQYAEKGLDGFFADNADVYYHYSSDAAFDGLCRILEGLGAYNIPIIINGADVFVSKCIKEEIAVSLFEGINQETVFTRIDFENNSYGIQHEADTRYFQEYLARASSCGLSVYLLEYCANGELAKKIDDYCSENGFRWYNAEGTELR